MGQPIKQVAFDFHSIRELYASGKAVPADIIRLAYDRIAEDNRSGLWISLRPLEKTLEIAEALPAKPTSDLPLYGLPFGVKDNIDAANLETTAACPAYAYMPERSAKVVEKLEAAGAICIGKTNLDQFATGLNGTRSPYGPCGAAFDPQMVSGGSSSGSGVAVALHQVAFSIGTDTGGSGRIPAGLNNVIGLKPTVGALSTKGLVPCCRTLDCPSVFALSIEDAHEVAAAAFEIDRDDASLRSDLSNSPFSSIPTPPGDPRLLIVKPEQQEFFGNTEGHKLYNTALEKFSDQGAELIPIDFAPFAEAGQMMFEGVWVAERYTAIGKFLETQPNDILPTTRAIVENGRKWTAIDAFRQMYRAKEIQTYANSLFANADALIVPTVATLYSISEMQADPIVCNNHHGYYSYFANILDLSGLSCPAGFYKNGMPFGVTLLAPAYQDAKLASIGRHFLHSASKQQTLGKPRL